MQGSTVKQLGLTVGRSSLNAVFDLMLRLMLPPSQGKDGWYNYVLLEQREINSPSALLCTSWRATAWWCLAYLCVVSSFSFLFGAAFYSAFGNRD